MMPYSVALQVDAIDDIRRLDAAVARQVRSRLEVLAANAESVRHHMLTGRLRGLFRLRVGDYRVLYTMNRSDRKIIVHAVRHRSEVYRRG